MLIAALQMNCTSDVARNLDQLETLARRAAGYGARFLATPENTTFLGPPDQKIRIAEPVDGPLHQRLGALARELEVELLVGSVAERCDDQRAYNTSILFGPDGAIKATYRKLHLFDVDLAKSGGITYKESARTAAGDELVVADSSIGRLGLSICFDLRFPELYRGLVARGATALSVPAAFTLMTGKDHWHTLLRARAIECQSWVIAAAQWGPHDDAGLRRSYGHSLIVDPWGTIVGECGDGVGVCLAEIDPARVEEVRQQIPLSVRRC